MSDFDFEARLERLYAQPPRVGDADLFALEVEERLEREWTFRRALIGVAGLVGAGVMLSQTLGSETLARLSGLAEPAGRLFSDALGELSPQALAAQTPMLWSGEALWTIAALGGLAAAFFATRWADQL